LRVVGAFGTVPVGEIEELAVLYEPVPTDVTAATRNRYPVPFESPETVVESVADVPSENVVQVEPELLLYCTT
jgi:hypothetical protein